MEADIQVAYPGKPISRKSLFKSSVNDKVKPHLSVNESDHDDDDTTSLEEEFDNLDVEGDNTDGSESDVHSNDEGNSEVEIESNEEDDDNEGNNEDGIDSNDESDQNDEDGDDSSGYRRSITGFGEESKPDSRNGSLRYEEDDDNEGNNEDIDSNDEGDLSEEDEGGLSEENEDDLSEENEGDLSEENEGDLSEEDEGDLSEEDEDDSSDYGGSITGFEEESKRSDGEEEAESEDDSQNINIFSAQARDIKSDIEKGNSIRNQSTIWEKLIECRIKLQPALINTNKLYQREALKEFKNQLNSEEEEILSQTYSVLSKLMKGLLELQDVALNAAPEYREIKNMKRKSDPSGLEEPEEKKIRSEDFLQVIHEDFKPFKDNVIQKWNEKTKLSYGRMSKSDFSAFDQPTLKQIEEILLDRSRLLKRTQIKKSDYQVLGKSKAVSDEASKEGSKTKDIQECDPEIFDDDDFYHKLLRDFIENKTSDSSEFSKRGKQWLELQKLRSRMKAKVDTRASKGRKIRFTVNTKMVNFMAPVPSFSWSEEAKNELFNSLFGQALKQKS
ncbi:unnamed protein product [Nezara viridula]|uniref:Protein AATF n=1 Tax=Nezara viridula TaxID=85310 RepID=A0A9P0HR58_NEZVI|nr:unnamed protein product [Nezara viridula]